jgi:transcriptional regulator with XRE-family HTH domain
MARVKTVILPSLQRLLSTLGENIRLARLRRKISAAILAQRAGIARNTLRAIERGDARTSLGAYANVLFSLGLAQDLKLIARDDELGRKLQDANLPVKARVPRLIRSAKSKREKTHK